ncbi:hypothetical protein H4R35_002357 [Dimargaris xerosporica]|nr:hypothetical protein H4R35_002357 [Dimargaris xerosporica]
MATPPKATETIPDQATQLSEAFNQGLVVADRRDQYKAIPDRLLPSASLQARRQRYLAAQKQRRSTFRDLIRNVTGVDTASDTELPITSSSSKRKYDNASSEDEGPATVGMSNETKRVRTGGKYHDTKRIDKSKSSRYK